jgi:hypothetical protein
VKIRFFNKGTVWIICFALLFSVLAFASEIGVARIQGKVMELDVKKNMMVVNEKFFAWDRNTFFYNEKGSPITVEKLKINNWVYIEGVRDGKGGPIMIDKIYLLPKYVGAGERNLYPFIQ